MHTDTVLKYLKSFLERADLQSLPNLKFYLKLSHVRFERDSHDAFDDEAHLRSGFCFPGRMVAGAGVGGGGTWPFNYESLIQSFAFRWLTPFGMGLCTPSPTPKAHFTYARRNSDASLGLFRSNVTFWGDNTRRLRTYKVCRRVLLHLAVYPNSPQCPESSRSIRWAAGMTPG